jgi:thioester reductase-like protein
MGLAAGYLNRPDLTAASFVDTPAGRLYRTGDLGRWTHTGELQILGRSDDQVKLRGQRVELGEIEHRLETYAGVRQAVAAVETKDDGTQVLWAFVTLEKTAPEPTQAQWHEHLSARLPSYMIPSAVLKVPAIRLNTAGKVDRAALLANLEPAASGIGRSQPREGIEQSIAQVWAEHLDRPFIAREDRFFDLGGDSLRAIAVINHLRRDFQCTINDLYEHPRLAEFAGVCRPQPDHLRTVIRSAATDWREYRRHLAAYEAERQTVLAGPLRAYEARNEAIVNSVSGKTRNYGRVLLTGATGYVGSYVLRELLLNPDRHVSVLVRAADDRAALVRLAKTLQHYFGATKGAAFANHPRLSVLSGDLRKNDLGLSAKSYDRLADGLQAVFHCAANVNHFGHAWEFHEDNVAATARLLKLAARHAAAPADFHLASTLSVCGSAPEEGFRLFTEYDLVAEAWDENYYVRSKQEAENLVVAARQNLANACVHRVGNVVFASDGGPLQYNIQANAFFRQIAAFLSLGAVPDDAHLWLCHVDVVARALVLLAEEAGLTNETHHLENARRDSMADFVASAQGVHACTFEEFLERLERAVDEPGMEAPLAETLENFHLYRGLAPQSRARRLEIVSTRTQNLMARLGLVWPDLPADGQRAMLHETARLSARSNPSSGAPFEPDPSAQAALLELTR